MATFETGPLCGFCSEIDFQILFSSTLKLYEFTSDAEVSIATKCPSCKLFSRCSGLQRLRGLRIRNVLYGKHGLNNDMMSSKDQPTSLLHYRCLLNKSSRPSNALDRVERFPILEWPFSDKELLERLLRRRPVAEQVDINLLQSWAAECEEPHDHAQTALGLSHLSTFNPIFFRAIDVNRKQVINLVPQRYISLSYVWGEVMLNYSRAKAIRSDGGLDLDHLPLTFKDAIQLTKMLGETYLWIDWICVDQHNPDELKAIVPCMGMIYSCASITIVAAAGTDACAGLPGLRPGTRHYDTITVVQSKSGPVEVTPVRESINALVANTRWNTRGWAYQEHLLSTRCLFFTASEVFYSCPRNLDEDNPGRIPRYGLDGKRFSHWREAYHLETKSLATAYDSDISWNNGWQRTRDPPIRPSLDMNTDKLDLRFLQYTELIGDYTQRSLSDPADIVAAIVGILSKLWSPQELGTALHHGIVQKEFGKGLLWYSGELSRFKRRRCVSSWGFGFPSWSWAGWNGPVSFGVGYSRRSWVYKPAYERRPKAGYLKLQPALDFYLANNTKIIGTRVGEACLRKRITLSQKKNPNELEILTTCLRPLDSGPTHRSIQGFFGFQGGALHVDSALIFNEIWAGVPNGAHKQLAMLEIFGGERVPLLDSEDWAGSRDEVVALLVRFVGDQHAERIGIACIPASLWDGKDVRRETRWVTLQ